MWSVLTDWTLEPTVVAGLAIAALLYGRGAIYSRRHGQATQLHWWRVLAFYGGLLVIFVALESALDDYAEQVLWAHMIQHELLMMVAPPLLLLGMPTLPVWRAVPLALALHARCTSRRYLDLGAARLSIFPLAAGSEAYSRRGPTPDREAAAE